MDIAKDFFLFVKVGAMLVLPTLTQNILNKKMKEKVPLLSGVFVERVKYYAKYINMIPTLQLQ